MAERALLELLEQQLRQVRSWTWSCVEGRPEEWIYRRVEWTENTIGWHMGHLSWELDLMTDVSFAVDRELDAGWDRLFAAGCAVHAPDEYPPVERLAAVFDRSMRRFLEHLGQVEEDAALARRLPSHPDNHTPG
ncbi:MAG TPA: DinB family protein, partial [Thermomicrobiales bacterium]|nr:DinB family protein [Thermomicrobiales bacterium]